MVPPLLLGVSAMQHVWTVIVPINTACVSCKPLLYVDHVAHLGSMQASERGDS